MIIDGVLIGQMNYDITPVMPIAVLWLTHPYTPQVYLQEVRVLNVVESLTAPVPTAPYPNS